MASDSEDANDGPQPLSARLAGASSVLLLAPAFTAGNWRTCAHLVLDRGADTNVLAVTYAQPEQWLRHWREHIDEIGGETAIVTVGELDRDGDADGATRELEVDDRSVGITSSSPDLTKVGIRISDRLEGWAADDRHVHLCFNSITHMLQYADVGRVFRFLHVFIGRLQTLDAVGHFHMDPGAHDEQTLNTLSQLFDVIVRIDDDGEVTVRGA